MSARDTFAARFGEGQARAIEAAAQGHYAEAATTLFKMFDSFGGGPHSGDNFGSDPFRYWFLLAVGHRCVTNPDFRRHHEITADIELMKEWAHSEGALNKHDGDCPDNTALTLGIYREWMSDGYDSPKS
jgi:hypothetical protein